MLLPEPIDLGELVRETVAHFLARRAARSTSREGRRAGEDCWDRLRLEQILTNLLSNAVKYGAGRPISVEVGAAGPGNDADAWIAVRDRGIGMSADELGRIFGRFERGVSERNYGGLGLGLWIVRQIVDAMGGSITVDSAPERGSTFTVRLPRRAPIPG